MSKTKPAILVLKFVAVRFLTLLMVVGVAAEIVRAEGLTVPSSSPHAVKKKIKKQLPPNMAPALCPYIEPAGQILPPDVVEEIRLYKLDLYRQFRRLHPQPIKKGSEIVVYLDRAGSINNIEFLSWTKKNAEEHRLLKDIRKLKYKPLPKGMPLMYAWVIFGESRIGEMSHNPSKSSAGKTKDEDR